MQRIPHYIDAEFSRPRYATHEKPATRKLINGDYVLKFLPVGLSVLDAAPVHERFHVVAHTFTSLKTLAITFEIQCDYVETVDTDVKELDVTEQEAVDSSEEGLSD